MKPSTNKKAKKPKPDALDLANEYWLQNKDKVEESEDSEEHITDAFVAGFAIARRQMGYGRGETGKIDKLIANSSLGLEKRQLDEWRAFGAKLRERRKQAGLTLGELSDLSRLRLGYLIEVEHGVACVNDEQLTAICKVLNIEPPPVPESFWPGGTMR